MRTLRTIGVYGFDQEELAPTTEMRQLQYAEDARRGKGKRSRTVLAPAYVERYTALDRRQLGGPALRGARP